MARTPPSEAEIRLSEHISARGVKATPRQLERWRGWGYLEQLERRGLGRGQGSVSLSPDEAMVERGAEVAALVAEGLSRTEVGLVLFARRRPLPAKTVRDIYRDAFEGLLDAVEREAREGESTMDTLGRLAVRYARRPPDERSATWKRRLRARGNDATSFADAVYALMVGAFTGQVTSPEGLGLAAAAGGLTELWDATAEAAARLAEVIAHNDVHSLIARVRDAEMRDLDMARDDLLGLRAMGAALATVLPDEGLGRASRELAAMSDHQVALCAPMLAALADLMPREMSQWRRLVAQELSRMQQLASFVSAMPAHLPVRDVLRDATELDRLPPDVSEELATHVNAYVEGHAEELEALGFLAG